MRKEDGKTYQTDNGNYILDCAFGQIDHPSEVSQRLNSIPGVIENGLFVDMADLVIIGKKDGFEKRD